MRLTNTSVAALELPPGKDRLMVYDDEVKGYGVRVSAKVKQFFVQYRTQAGESRRETLGKFPMLSASEARKLASDRIIRVRSGEDPRAQIKKARQAPTLGSLVEPYLAERESQVSEAWFKNMKRYLTQLFEPLHKVPVRELTRSEVHRVLQEIKRDNGATTANRAQAALSRFYGWLVATDAADHNIVTGTEKPASEKKRDRVLKPAELAAIWKATHSNGPNDFADIVRLLILTGQRREEVAAMLWSEVDQAGALWSMPGERTKNGNPHDVPLSAEALAVIARRPVIEDRDLMFGTGSGPFSGFSKAKAALDKRSGISDWRLHDLRRTAATMMADVLKVPPHVVEAILNHVSGSKAGVAGIYNRAAYATEKREALDLWACHIAAL